MKRLYRDWKRGAHAAFVIAFFCGLGGLLAYIPAGLLAEQLAYPVPAEVSRVTRDLWLWFGVLWVPIACLQAARYIIEMSEDWEREDDPATGDWRNTPLPD